MEEYYSDLMSGLYQLPQHFFLGAKFGNNKKYSANEVSQEKLNEFVKIEKIVYQLLGSKYPTTSERTWTGVTIAKKLLECEGLDKNVKAYLEWIVSNNDNILKTDIREDYNKHSFDPSKADDLDKHLTTLIRGNKIPVTEAAMNAIADSTEFSEWLANGLVYDESEITFQELCEVTNEYERIIYEMNLSTKATGYKDESIGKRVLMFIPRLLHNLLEIIMRVIRGIGHSTVDGIYKLLSPDKMYHIDINLQSMLITLTTEDRAITEIYERVQGATDLNDYINRISNIDFAESMGGKKIYDPKTGLEIDIGDNAVPLDKFSAKKNVAEGVEKAYQTDFLTGKSFSGKYTGKEIADMIATVHKIGNKLVPKLNQMFKQYKRLTNKEANFS